MWATENPYVPESFGVIIKRLTTEVKVTGGQEPVSEDLDTLIRAL